MSKTKTLDDVKELLNGEITDSGYKLNCDFSEVSGEDYLKIIAVDYEKYPVIARIEDFEGQIPIKQSKVIFQHLYKPMHLIRNKRVPKSSF